MKVPDDRNWHADQRQIKAKVDDFADKEANLRIQAFSMYGGIEVGPNWLALESSRKDHNKEPEDGQDAVHNEGVAEQFLHGKQPVVQENHAQSCDYFSQRRAHNRDEGYLTQVRPRSCRF